MMASEGRVSLTRRLLLWATRRLRRSRFLPVTMVNRVADEHRLGQALTQRVLVYFPTALGTLYQVRPWYEPLRALDAVHPLVMVFRDSRTAERVRSETDFDCLSVGTSAQLDDIVLRSDVALALYVNLDPLDFDCLRFASMTHVYIGHGDSDKEVFVSNQVKAFDKYFVAGPAAVERLGHHLAYYDAAQRCVVIGQPQLDGFNPAEPEPSRRAVVVYAPTWEGANPSSSYSSLLSHGPALVDSLIRDGGYDVVYRPHPLTGVEDPRYAAADHAIRRMLETTGHRVDVTETLESTFSGAAVLITDVSATVSYWLTTGRPVLMTKPTSEATVPEGSLSASLPGLDAHDAGSTAAVVASLLVHPPPLDAIASFHLGDLREGDATASFIDACTELVDSRQHRTGS